MPLEAPRMADGVAASPGTLGLVPARPVGVETTGVEPQAGDRHVDVAAMGVDRDPPALAATSPAGVLAGSHRSTDEAGALQREGDGTRAVVAGVLPLGMAAAVPVRVLGDLIAGCDHALDGARRVGRGNSQALLGDAGLGGMSSGAVLGC